MRKMNKKKKRRNLKMMVYMKTNILKRPEEKVRNTHLTNIMRTRQRRKRILGSMNGKMRMRMSMNSMKLMKMSTRFKHLMAHSPSQFKI